MKTSSAAVATILLVSLFCCAFQLSCKNKLEDINAIIFIDTMPISTGKDIEVVFSDSGQIQATMRSPFYKSYGGRNPYTEMPQGINLVFYDSAMNVKSRLTSKYAIKYEKTEMMEAKNDVVVVNEKGETLRTEHLIWDEKKQKIYSDVSVRITAEDKIFLGTGMEADESFMKWRIKKPSGTLYLKDKEFEN